MPTKVEDAKAAANNVGEAAGVGNILPDHLIVWSFEDTFKNIKKYYHRQF